MSDESSDAERGLDALGWSTVQSDDATSRGLVTSDSFATGRLGRVSRIDRGWSTVMVAAGGEARVRNVGVDVAVGDFVVIDSNVERIEVVCARRSALVRRASSEGVRPVADVVAANVDVVFVVHAMDAEPNPRRLERELVVAFDSGATPVVVLNKSDLVDTERRADVLAAVGRSAAGCAIVAVSAERGEGIADLRAHLDGSSGDVHMMSAGTGVVIGASGVGKSSLVNALLDGGRQAVGAVRGGDRRGRHTTVAAELLPLPGGGWIVDTPGLRAVSLWHGGRGLERAFPEIFALAEGCRFRDCKHESEPSCEVRAAVAAGRLDVERLDSLRALVDEEAELERAAARE